MNLLIAVPVKYGLSELLLERLMIMTQILMINYPDATLALHHDVPRATIVRSDPEYVWKRSSDLAAVRNDLLHAWLKPEHTHILWLDADIVEFPVDLPERLAAAGGDDCIVAPMILLEDSEQYYDTYTHIMDTGKAVGMSPPYFGAVGNASLIEMACVGGCYLIPAQLHWVVDYEPHGGPGMEHWALMQRARAVGYQIFVDRHTTVRHACLPNWGESFH